MPIVGLGLAVFPEDPKVVYDTLNKAIPMGYRSFDTASLYRTEVHLGNALKEVFSDPKGTLRRENFFITTKLPQIGMRPDLVDMFLTKSLLDLQMDYVDLYLIHWPIGMEFRGPEAYFPFTDVESKRCAYDLDTDLEAVWTAMEKVVKAGKAKAIGLSNFSQHQIERIMKVAEIPPANLQVELHAYLQQPELRRTCEKHGISITAYYPIGGQSRLQYPKDWQLSQAVPLLQDPIVVSIANKHGKTPAQILLRFLTQLNVAVIPKSSNNVRLQENFNVLNFELTPEDLVMLKKLDKGESGRSCFGMPGCESHPEYPFAV